MALSRITEAVASFTDLTIGDDLTLTDDLLMASDANIIKFGADADVTLTHVHNTGLLLNSTSVIQFNDASQNIGAPNATTLDINATDEIELNATLIDVNGNLDVSGTIVGAGAITGGGLLTTGGNIVIPDAGNIGSASDTNAIGISSGGVVSITATTANTSASNGALTVAGGVGIAADLSVGDDLRLISDAAVLNFGADSDVTLTHVADTGLLLNSSRKLQFSDAAESVHSDGSKLILTSNSVAFSLPTADGSSGQILQTNGSGVLSFVTASANTPSSADGQALGSASLEWSDLFLADGGQILFGNDQDITLTHVADTGLTIKNTGTGNAGMVLNLVTGDTAITANNVLGEINFAAPDESSGTDAILNGARIIAMAEGTFAADNNATKLSFQTGASEAPSEKMSLSSAGNLTISGTYTGGGLMTTGGNIVIPDSGNIGSASDTDAIAIASNGQVTFSQTLIGTALDISGDIDVDGTTNLDVVDIDGAVDMASTLQVDGSITSSAAATITVADNSAALTIVSTDADGNSGPQMNFSRASGSPADDDYIGRMNFIGRNDAGQDFVGVDILTRINDASDGTEDASFFLTTMENGSQVSKIEMLPGETVVNQGGASVDFRVEGDTDTNNLIVDASGNRVGIGVAAPASKLEISAGGNSHGLLRLDETDASNLSGYLQFDSNGTNKANIQNANNAGIHLCVGTGGTVTFTALGYTAANALDDYEEGTWTPAFQSTNASFSYASQGGTYTKVGRLIMASFRLALSGSPGGTTSNSVVVSGLPFNSASLEQTYHGGAFGHYFGFNLSQTGVMVYQTATGATTVELKVVGDNLGETGVLASHLNSTAQIRGQIIYHTA